MKLRIRQGPLLQRYYLEQKGLFFWTTLSYYDTLKEAEEAVNRLINKDTLYYKEYESTS